MPLAAKGRKEAPTLFAGASCPRLRGHGFAHRARGGRRQILTGGSQFLDRFANQCTELAVSFFLGAAVADAAPREQVRTVSNIQTVLLFPSDEFQILVFGFHLHASRMALRTCFS